MWDDRAWKHDLHRQHAALAKDLAEQSREDLLRTITIERFVLVTAYMIRKLSEADTLTEELTEFGWPIARVPCINEPPHRFWFSREDIDGRTWQPLDSHYDFGTPTDETMKLARLCNLFVHHFAFEARPAGKNVDILFNSRETRGHLYRIGLDTYMGFVSEVASDEAGWVDTNIARKTRPVRLRRRRPPDWP